jgi:hypothetical protein
LPTVQRLGQAEEAVRREERRLAALRRISEATSAAETSGAPVAEGDHDDNRLSTNSALSQDTAPSTYPQPPGLLLPPFRLSYGSHDSSTSLAGLSFVYAGSAASPSASPDLDDGAEFGDLGNSTTAAFLSSASSSSEEDDDDRSLTPTQAGRRREYAIHHHQHFSPETFGVGRPRESNLSSAEGAEGWAWREAALPMLPTTEGEGEEDVVSH